MLELESHLLPILNQEETRLLLQKQLVKDFASSDLYFPLNFETEVYTVERLLFEVEQQVVNLLVLGERKTLTLLYRIDIPEQDFLKLTLQENIASKLTLMIVKREALKIYFRLKYSG